MDNRKERGLSYLLWCISISFMLLVFAPLEIYFTNKNEFWFDLKQLVPVIISCFVLGTLLLGGAYLLIGKIKLFSAIYTILLGILLGLYIQGNYIPRNYGVFDGTDIQWSDFKGYSLASILLWGGILLATYICVRRKKILYQVGRLISICIVLIQVMTIGVLIFQTPAVDNYVSNVVTNRGLLDLSKNRNILVFILDAFDSAVFRDMLTGDDAEHYKQILENFTYYPDASGGYPTTKGALPLILTGQWYENEVPYGEYVEDAYNNTDLYNVLREEGYTIGLYTGSQFINSKTDSYENLITGKYQISDNIGLAGKLYKMVFFNYAPHQLKQFFVTYSEDFSKYRRVDGESVYSYDVPEFYHGLLESGLKVNIEKNVFRFYHLDGNHPPYTFGSQLVEDKNIEYDVKDEAKGCLNLLEEYFGQLRETGAYDNTAIVIMADHGATSDNGTTFNLNPLFLVKDFGANHSFEISDTAISWENISELFKALAQEEKSNDFWKSMEKTERRFLQYSWDNQWNREYLPRISEYKVVGHAYEEENDVMIPTGRIYESQLEDNSVRFNFTQNIKIIPDENDQNYKDLVIYGFDTVENPDGKPFVWTNKEYNYFKIGFQPGFDKNFKVTLDVGRTVGNSTQTIIAYANGTKIEDAFVENNKICVNIPNTCIEDSSLDLIVYYPDAYVPGIKIEGETDMRKLAFCITEIVLEEY